MTCLMCYDHTHTHVIPFCLRTPPTEVTTGLAPAGGEQCISPERRRQGGGAPGGPQEAPRAAGRQRKSPRRGRPTGQQRSRRTHHHHRFRRPARREQPADGVHWAHYPRECVRSQTPREQVPVTQADIFYQSPRALGAGRGGEKYPPCRSLISEQNQKKPRDTVAACSHNSTIWHNDGHNNGHNEME